MQSKSLQWILVALTFVLIVLMSGCATSIDTKQLIAKHEILDLISQYSYNWDSKNPDGLAEIVTEDAAWEWWTPGAQKPGVVHKPRKKFRDWAAERFNTNLADRQTRHFQTNTVFLELGNDRARTRTMILVTQAIKGQKGPKIPAHSGTYEDEFRKTPDGWRISRRLLRTD